MELTFAKMELGRIGFTTWCLFLMIFSSLSVNVRSREICSGYSNKFIRWSKSESPVFDFMFADKKLSSLSFYVFIRELYEGCVELEQHLVISNIDERELKKDDNYRNFLKRYNETELNFDFLDSIENVDGSVIIEYCHIDTIAFRNLKMIGGNFLGGMNTIKIDNRLNFGIYAGRRVDASLVHPIKALLCGLDYQIQVLIKYVHILIQK